MITPRQRWKEIGCEDDKVRCCFLKWLQEGHCVRVMRYWRENGWYWRVSKIRPKS
jgi:hypothetical protein